jgi:hypothetical protein
MALLSFQQRWPVFVSPAIFFCLGMVLLPYPGIQNDEVLFANAYFGTVGSSLYSLPIFHHHLPLMALTYLGALKTWLYAPILWLAPPSYLTVRLPVLLLGAVTLLLFVRLLEAAHGRRAAIVGGFLLATGTMFTLTTCFDWGPVALQHVLLVSGMLLMLKFCTGGAPAALFFGFCCFGMGMWDKALFNWILAGLVVAAACVFPRELWRRLSIKSVSLAAAGFCLGALPLLAYNVTQGLPTFRSNSSFTFHEFGSKAKALQSTWNGSALLGYIANQPQAGYPREAQGAMERASFALHSAAGDHPKNRLEAAFYAALLLAPLLWFSGTLRKLLFCLVALGVAWFLMAITKGAGMVAHHAVLLWPIPHLFLAMAFAEASMRWKKMGAWFLAVGVLYLAAENLLVTNQYVYQLARYGGAHSWTDAIYPLSAELGRDAAQDVVVDDWGIIAPLVLLHRGQLKLVYAGNDFFSPESSGQKKDWERGLLLHGLWLGHTDEFEEFPGTNQRVSKGAAAVGFRKELVKLVSDRNGRPTFEIFHFVPGTSGPRP